MSFRLFNYHTRPIVAIPAIPPLGLFTNGSSNQISATTKVNFTTSTTTAGTAFSGTTYKTEPGQTGSATTAYVGGGGNHLGQASNTVMKYVFQTDTMISGTNLTMTKRDGVAACGNNTIGMFIGGYFPTADTSKYTYNNDTTTVGTSLSYVIESAGGSGNTTAGYVSGGFGVGAGAFIGAISRYTYSSDVVSIPASLSVARTDLVACSNSTIGIHAGGTGNSGNVTTVDKHTHASETITAGTSLSVLNTSGNRSSAMSNSVYGLIGGGHDGVSPLQTIEKYIYATDARTIYSSSLVNASNRGSGSSNCHGGI